MTPDKDKRRSAGFILLGVGIALNALALSGTRYMGQRVLYIAAGVLFIVAAIVRLRKPGGADTST